MNKEILKEIINNEVSNKENNLYITEYLLKLNDTTNVNNSVFHDIISILKDTKQFTWETMCMHIKLAKGIPGKILGFYSYLNEIDYNFGNFNDYIKRNHWILDANNYSENLYYEGSIPENIYILNAKNRRMKLYLGIENENIRDIIIGFLDELKKGNVFGEGIRRFVLDFEKSLEGFDLSEININSFDEKTFDKQFKYYEKIDIIPELKKFYKHLIDIRNEDIFSMKSGLNKNFLDKDNFANLYSQGYRVVYLNRADDLPKIDRWLLSPNGYEKYTTTMKATDFLNLDFSRVKSKEIKENLKKWAFYEQKSMKTLKNAINNIFVYFEFIQNMNEQNKNIVYINNGNYSDSLIKKNEVIIFLKYIKDKKYKQNTLNAYSSSLASFVNYLIREGNRIDPQILEFLRVRKPIELSGKVIEKSDYNKIFNNLKQSFKLGNFEKLRYIFMYLLATTNFRPSEILSLKRNCIVETMKKDEFKIVSGKEVSEEFRINMTTKTSAGEVSEINPSRRTIELINMAIEITKEIAFEADIELRDYIFLEKKKKTGKVKEISQDRMYRSFKKVLKECDIKENKYTLYNFRHTYMTTLFNKCDIRSAFMASGHNYINTTLRYYIHPEIQDYLEALYGIDIGNVKINGSVVEKFEKDGIKEDIKSITVKQGCGYCNGSCVDNDKIDCLICKSFVVTIDREPYFKEEIKKIDSIIESEEIMHEKEHLISIKKLYLAYLAQIYSIRMEKDNGKK